MTTYNDAIEDAARVAEDQAKIFASDGYATGQPLSSFNERFACKTVAEAIRALKRPEAEGPLDGHLIDEGSKSSTEADQATVPPAASVGVVNGPECVSLADLSREIADIKSDMNHMAAIGCRPMWASFIGRLDDMLAALTPPGSGDREAPPQGTASNETDAES